MNLRVAHKRYVRFPWAGICLWTIVSIGVTSRQALAADTPVPGSNERTEIVIIGTLHGGHNKTQEYTTQHLKRIILDLKPAAVLQELPPTIVSKNGEGIPMATITADGRVSRELVNPGSSSPELLVIDEAARELGVREFPYDREGLNEFYRKSKYDERMAKLNASLMDRTQQLTKDGPKSIEDKIYMLLMNAVIADARLKSASPRVINSEAYDSVIRIKHAIFHDIIPTMLAEDPGRKDLVAEFHFFRDEWQTRNGIMAENIARIAAEFPGKRLVVTTGTEHRYMLRDLLAKRPSIDLKEFWEILSAN